MKIAGVSALIVALILAGCVSSTQQPSQDALTFRDAFFASPSEEALIEAAPFYVDACRRSAKNEYSEIEGFENTVVCIDGDIEDHSVAELNDWSGADDNLVVVALSGGGLAGLAIELVEMWGVGDYDIIIDRDCHSACANYFFAGARYKIILGAASLSWHGGMPRNKDEFLSSFDLHDLSNSGRDFIEESWGRFVDIRIGEKAIYERQGYVEDIMFMLPAAAQCAGEESAEKLDEIYSIYDDEDIASENWRPSRIVLTEVFKFTNVYFQNPALYDDNIYYLRMDDGREFTIEFSIDCLMRNYDLHKQMQSAHH